MERREQVEETIDIRLKLANTYQHKVTFADVKKAEGVLDTDEVYGVGFRSGFEHSFGDEWGGQRHYSYPVLVIKRIRPETDEEFEARMKKITLEAQTKYEKDKLLYLQLKAQFEK